MITPLRFEDGVLHILDQTRLPAEQHWLRCTTPRGRCTGNRTAGNKGRTSERRAASSACPGPPALVSAIIEARERDATQRIAEHGATLFGPNERVLTHCNTGALATTGAGTALGVIEAAWRHGAVAHVWVDETRPLNQGARLTAYELDEAGIPFQVITDSSAGLLMARGLVDRIVVGADRIAANGDVANKIGTYPLAVLADRHSIPFVVAAPTSTVDTATATGADIPIEERDPSEVTPHGHPAANFAFDITPAELVTALVTEEGVTTRA